jgi:hypothetical protein
VLGRVSGDLDEFGVLPAAHVHGGSQFGTGEAVQLVPGGWAVTTRTARSWSRAKSRAASAADDPSYPTTTCVPVLPPRPGLTTTTGQCEFAARSSPVEPVRPPIVTPRPRLPMTTSCAAPEALTSADDGEPLSMRVSTASPGARTGRGRVVGPGRASPGRASA